MKALEELYNAPSCNFVKYPLCTNYVQCLQYLQVLKYSSTYKYLAKYLSISTSTLGKLRKYLSKVQVLSNLYLSVLKYKYSCTWPHVWCTVLCMSVVSHTKILNRTHVKSNHCQKATRHFQILSKYLIGCFSHDITSEINCN